MSGINRSLIMLVFFLQKMCQQCRQLENFNVSLCKVRKSLFDSAIKGFENVFLIKLSLKRTLALFF